jgi:hypothetical protein
MPNMNMHKELDIVTNFKSNVDDTLNAQYEYMTTVRRSYMYEFIILCVVAIIVLVITIRNLMSDTATTAGYIFCWIILILFVISVIMYVVQLIGAIKLPSSSSSFNDHSSGPVIRIHYV